MGLRQSGGDVKFRGEIAEPRVVFEPGDGTAIGGEVEIAPEDNRAGESGYIVRDHLKPLNRGTVAVRLIDPMAVMIYEVEFRLTGIYGDVLEVAGEIVVKVRELIDMNRPRPPGIFE